MTTGVVVGYARVSSSDQNLDVQIDMLKSAGCTKIFSEKKSGKTMEGREQLDECLKYCREGDTLVVCRLDRFARSMKDFCDLVRLMQEKGVGFKCLNPGLDTTGAVGELTAQILMAVAQFELTLRSERQREGIKRAQSLGVYRGNIKAKTNRRRKTIQEAMAKYPELSAEKIAKLVGVSLRTVYRLCPEIKKGEMPETLRIGMERRRQAKLQPVTF